MPRIHSLILSRAALLGALGFIAKSQAADVIKADTANPYNSPLSWVGGAAAPGAGDVAVWNSTVATAANLTNVLGADLSWGGIRLANNVLGPVQISAGNTLALGASGLDLSVASADLVLANALTLGAAQNWNVGSGRTVTSSGVIAINNTLTKTGAGNLVLNGANTGSGGVTLSSGTLTIGNAGSVGATTTLNANGGTLALNADLSSGVNVNFGGPVLVQIGANRVIGGNSASTLITGNGALSFNGLTSGRVFTFSGNMAGFTGTIDLGTNAGIYRFNSGGGNNALGNAGATFNLGSSTGSLNNRNGGNVTYHLGALSGGPGTVLQGRSSGSGATASTYSIGALGTSTLFAGTIINGGDNNGVNVFKTGAGTFTLSGTNTYTGNTVVQQGTLALGATGSFASSASLSISNGATFDVSALSAGYVVPVAQTVRGNGTVAGNVTVLGTLAPGASIGTLTFNNYLALAGTTTIELDRDAAQKSDFVNVLGTLILGGTLNVVNTGAPLQAGDTFDFFNAPIALSSFSTVNLPSEVSWNTSQIAQGIITATAIPEPSAIALGALGLVALLWQARRRKA